jgi:hypothetical protein
MLKVCSIPNGILGRAKLHVGTVLSHRLSFTAFLTLVVVYYLLLLSNGTFQLFAPEMLDKAFNNMLVHLLHGEFTVDREAIGFEAFTRDDNTYAYFGIFPALLRLLAMPFTNIAQAELARFSCLTAVIIFVALQMRMLLIVHHSLPAASRRCEFLAVMAAATALSGPQLYILASASIYHEAILWSAAMAAAFNLVIIRTTFGAKSLRGRELVSLAALAGLAINTRPSIGVALYLGTILLVAWTGWLRYAPGYCTQQSSVTAPRLSSTILFPIAILGLAAGGVGVVNFERWGNAFTFADFRYWDMRGSAFPNLLEIIHKYGEFDVRRIWIGALYYTTGIPYLLKTIPPFAQFLRERVVGIEAPPVMPVLTNPLIVIFAGLGLYRVWWKPEPGIRDVTILRLALLGHASSILLILAAMAFTLRYRFDFAPFMTLAALVGYGSASAAVAQAPLFWRKRIRIAAIGLCFIGILSSHYVLLIHKVWSIAVPMDVRLALAPFAPFHYATLH